MQRRPQLNLAPSTGTLVCYRCSHCQQVLVRPDDVTPEQGMVELWAAFAEHIGEVHHDPSPVSVEERGLFPRVPASAAELVHLGTH